MNSGLNVKIKHLLVVVLALWTYLALAVPEVSRLAARQRYPWNGLVDIDYELSGMSPDATCVLSLSATNVSDGACLPVNIFQSLVITSAAGRVVWDAASGCEKDFKSPDVVLDASVAVSEYLILDISGGATAPSYPISKMSALPSGGWTDEYKTSKIVLVKCQPGRDSCGRYMITKPFYMGLFEITQRQWELVMGGWPGTAPSVYYGRGGTVPAYNVSYEDIRGGQVSGSNAVAAVSFLGRLRAKTGLGSLDLPTAAQWEYACRAGTSTDTYAGNGKTALLNVAWHYDNADFAKPVGGRLPNAWGLYDMLGNVAELCRDWEDLSSRTGVDPEGPTTGDKRSLRGGSYHAGSAWSSTPSVNWRWPTQRTNDSGFRLWAGVE